jgi:hypothetical protein
MKRVGIFILGACIILTGAASAYAWFGVKKSQAPAEKKAPAEQTTEQTKQQPSAPAAVAAPKMDKDLEKALREKWEASKKKMAQLNNTEWQIEMMPISGKGKKEQEIITFKNGQVSMSNFGKKGFPPTNISLTIKEDASVIWETMQTSEKSGVCFWRGELDKTLMTMRGVISHKIDDKNKMDYSFSSTSRRVLADK